MSFFMFVNNVLSIGIPFLWLFYWLHWGRCSTRGRSVQSRLRRDNVDGSLHSFLPAYYLQETALAPYANMIGIMGAAGIGVLLGILYALVTVTFKAPQGIAGIGLQMLGWGIAGTLFRFFIGGVTGVPGLPIDRYLYYRRFRF